MIAGIPSFFETGRASEARELWLLEDESFINAIFNVLVDTKVTPETRQQFVVQLRNGYSKHFVLSEIAERYHEVFLPGRMPGIRRRVKRYRLSRLPVIGWLFQRIFGIPGESSAERRMRVVENQLYLLAKLAYDSSNGRKLPLAPWGGVHRVVLVDELLEIESKLSPEAKAIFRELIGAASQIKCVADDFR